MNFNRKRTSQETRRKIGLGIKSHYDKKGRKGNKKKLVASAVLGAATIGLILKSRKGLKTQPTLLGLPSKVKKTSNQASKTFKDSLGKVYKKGSFLPTGGKGKGVSEVGLVKKPRDFTPDMKTGTVNQTRNSKGTRPDKDYFNNNWINK